MLSLDHKHHGIRFPGGITALLHNRLCDLNQSYYSNHIRAGQSWPNGQSVGFVTQWSRVRVSSLLCVCVCVCVHTHTHPRGNKDGWTDGWIDGDQKSPPADTLYLSHNTYHTALRLRFPFLHRHSGKKWHILFSSTHTSSHSKDT